MVRLGYRREVGSVVSVGICRRYRSWRSENRCRDEGLSIVKLVLEPNSWT